MYSQGVETSRGGDGCRKLVQIFPAEFSGDVNNRKDDFEPDFHFSSDAALKVATRALRLLIFTPKPAIEPLRRHRFLYLCGIPECPCLPDGGPSPGWNTEPLSRLRSGALVSPRSRPAAAPPQPGHLRHHLCGPAGSARAPPGPPALPRPRSHTRSRGGAHLRCLSCGAAPAGPSSALPLQRRLRRRAGAAPGEAPPPPPPWPLRGRHRAAAEGGRAAPRHPHRLPPLRPAGPSPAPRPGQEHRALPAARLHAGWTLSWSEAPLQLNDGSA